MFCSHAVAGQDYAEHALNRIVALVLLLVRLARTDMIVGHVLIYRKCGVMQPLVCSVTSVDTIPDSEGPTVDWRASLGDLGVLQTSGKRMADPGVD